MALDLTALLDTDHLHTDLAAGDGWAPAAALVAVEGPGYAAAPAPTAGDGWTPASAFVPVEGEGGDHTPAAPAAPGALRQALRVVVLAPRVVTVRPGRDDLRAILDNGETDLVEIRIRTELDLTAEDLATIAARGFTSAARVAASLRIPRRLAWKVPCGREALRLAIRPDAVIDQDSLSLDARVTSLDRLG